MDVTMKKDKLIEILQKNLSEHKEVYDEAVTGYFVDLADALEKLKKEVSGIVAGGKAVALDYSAIALHVPVSYEEVYKEILEMMMHTTDESILLTQDEFRKYVMDKWSWTNNFSASNSRYLSGQTQAKLMSK